MFHEKRLKQLMAKGLAVIFLITGCIGNMPMVAIAAVTEKQTTDWINVSSKTLELGTEGQNSFDFDIRKEASGQYDGVYWYVKEGKGTPDCITINHKTGEVKARHAGTAYIRCQLTLKDQLVARPEVKVTVVNKITAVEISNLPADLSITAGKTTDFDRRVLNTSEGKKVKSNGITRWEIAEDTAGVGEASTNGQVLPTKAGTFQLRAVSFANEAGYRVWINNKKENKSRITAASRWATIQVTASNGKGVAASQEELVKLLKASEITEITCDVSKFTNITVPAGDYKDKTITLKARQEGEFQVSDEGEIKSFTIVGTGTTPGLPPAILAMLQGAQVGSIVVSCAGLQLSLQVPQSYYLGSFALIQQGYVSFSGALPGPSAGGAASQQLSVSFGPGAGGSTISTTVPIYGQFGAPATISLLPGAAGSQLNCSSQLASTIMVNNQSGGSARLMLSGSSPFTIASSGSPLSVSDYQLKQQVIGSERIINNTVSKESPRAIAVTASAIILGQRVSHSTLTGTFVNSRNQTVSGRLQWNSPYQGVNSGYTYSWTFTPDDATSYESVTDGSPIVAMSVSEALSRAVTEITSTTFDPLSEAEKTSVVNIKAAMDEAITEVIFNHFIDVTITYENHQYMMDLYFTDDQQNTTHELVNITNKFFNNQDTSLAILPDRAQYVIAVSGSAITVVSGSSVSQLYSALVAQNEYSIMLPNNQIPNQSDTVTSDMYIEVIARNNVDRKTYSIIVQ